MNEATINIQSINCAMQHIRAFFIQHEEKKRADFGEPCCVCEYATQCRFDWQAQLDPLLKVSNVTIPLGREGHSGK